MLSTKDGQAAADDFRTKFAEPEEKKLQAKQAEITELNDKLQRGANTMSQTAQDDMKKSLDRKNTEYKRAVEDYQFDHDEMQRKLLDDLSAKMQTVIARYAQENACAIFLDVTNPNSGIMWISDTADVTRQIVDAYDKAQASAGTAGPAKPGSVRHQTARDNSSQAARGNSGQSLRAATRKPAVHTESSEAGRKPGSTYITSSLQSSRIDLTFAVN